MEVKLLSVNQRKGVRARTAVAQVLEKDMTFLTVVNSLLLFWSVCFLGHTAVVGLFAF